MKWRLLMTGVILALAGCTSPAAPAIVPATPAAVTATAGAAVDESGIIVALDGQAAVKRAGWREYSPALFGMAVRAGDLLRVAGGGRMTLACADLKLATVEGGPAGLSCEPSSQKLTFVYEGVLVNATRGDVPELQVLSPRKTRLLDSHPLLRWSAIPGADRYEVSVQGADWSSTVGPQTEMVYPTDAPALAPGKTYKLVVTAGDLTSEDETMPGLGFSVLADDEATLVRSAEQRIRALGLDDAATRLLIANLYASHQLYAEAIQQLEGISGRQEPTIDRMLADLYVSVGLGQIAEQQYLTALALSEQVGDLEGQALTQKALGDIYNRVLLNQDEGAMRRQRSLEIYERLGDTKMIEKIKQESLN